MCAPGPSDARPGVPATTCNFLSRAGSVPPTLLDARSEALNALADLAHEWVGGPFGEPNGRQRLRGTCISSCRKPWANRRRSLGCSPERSSTAEALSSSRRRHSSPAVRGSAGTPSCPCAWGGPSQHAGVVVTPGSNASAGGRYWVSSHAYCPALAQVCLAVAFLVGGAIQLGVAWLTSRYGVTIHNATDTPLLVQGLGVQWQVLPPDSETRGWQLPLLDRLAGGLNSPGILRAWASSVMQPDAEVVFCQDNLTSKVLDEQGRRIELVRGHLDPHGWSCTWAPRDVPSSPWWRTSGHTGNSGAS